METTIIKSEGEPIEAVEPAETQVQCYECKKDFNECELKEACGELVCKDCLADSYTSCEDCNDIIHHDDSVTVTRNDRTVCQTCEGDYTMCGNCERYEAIEDMNNVRGFDGAVCQNCIDHGEFFTCDSCCDLFHNDDYGDDGYCSSCANNSDGSSFESKEPKGEQVGELGDFKDRFVGVELEMYADNLGELADTLDAKSFGIGFHEDGSLKEGGIEIVTPKMKGEAIDKILGAICMEAGANNGRVDKTAGLHVHVDARDLDQQQISKLARAMFVFEPVIYAMQPAERRANRYCIPLAEKYTFAELRTKKFDEVYYKVSLEDKTAEADYELYLIRYQREVKDIKARIEARFLASDTPIPKRKTLKNFKLDRKRERIAKMNHRKREKYDSVRYCGMNLHSYYYRGTVEFRHHTGSLNPKKIRAWVILCQSIVEFAKKGYADARLVEVATEKDLGKKANIIADMLGLSPEIRNHIHERMAKFA